MLLETNNDLTNFLNEDEYLKPEMEKMNIAFAREEERNSMISKIDKLEDKLDLKNKEIKKLLQDKNAYINITNEALRELKDCVISQDDETAIIVIERLLYELTHLNSKYKNDTNTESYMEKVKMINSLNHCIRIENKRYRELKTLIEHKEICIDELKKDLIEKDKIIDKQDKLIEELAQRNNLIIKTINDLTSL